MGFAEKLVKAFGVVALIGALMIFAPLVGTCGGALGGWACGELFPETLRAFFGAVGIDLAPWQIGAGIGYVAGFLPRPACKSS